MPVWFLLFSGCQVISYCVFFFMFPDIQQRFLCCVSKHILLRCLYLDILLICPGSLSFQCRLYNRQSHYWRIFSSSLRLVFHFRPRQAKPGHFIRVRSVGPVLYDWLPPAWLRPPDKRPSTSWMLEVLSYLRSQSSPPMFSLDLLV